jgi:hypothetical protein
MTRRQPNMREGLPREAFAIVGDMENPDTWRLPHHKKSIRRALKGAMDVEQTVDWSQVSEAVSALSPSLPAKRVRVSPEEILEAAIHLAEHYKKADKPLPDILATLV